MGLTFVSLGYGAHDTRVYIVYDTSAFNKKMDIVSLACRPIHTLNKEEVLVFLRHMYEMERHFESRNQSTDPAWQNCEPIIHALQARKLMLDIGEGSSDINKVD